MRRITTLTLNPAIDSACSVAGMRHTRKLRASDERCDPGGGGINVARVIDRLGGRAHAIYLAGGATGALLDSLLDRAGLDRTRIDICGDCRISHAIYERESGREYRFVPEGPIVTEPEWEACLERLRHVTSDYLVVSGTLARGVPEDFYVRVQAIARARGMALVLDTSGPALRRTLSAGGVFLVKPSIGELEELVGRPLRAPKDLEETACRIVRAGQAEHVAVTMGHEGALFVGHAGLSRLPAIAVEARSAVGAGDSFVGAMTFGFASGMDAGAAFRLAVAAGTAAVLTPGNDLCHRADVDRLLALLPPGGG